MQEVQNKGDVIGNGQYLRVGDFLISGDYVAIMQDNGDLGFYYAVTTSPPGPDWSRPYSSLVGDSGSAHQVNTDPSWHYDASKGGGQYYAIMQSDGNFVLYRGTYPDISRPYWASNTQQSQPGQFSAMLGIDGNFMICPRTPADVENYRRAPQLLSTLWASQTEWVSQRVTTSDRLQAGQWLAVGDYLVSADGQFAAMLQNDGNFVLFHTTTTSPPAPDLTRRYWDWAQSLQPLPPPQSGGASSALPNPPGAAQSTAISSLTSPGPHHARMQTDGNFVLYEGANPGHKGKPYLASNTSSSIGQYTAVMQTDGNFVVYFTSSSAAQDALWASGTDWVTQRVSTGDRLKTGQWLGTNDYLVSANRNFVAVMQGDGNFVLYYATFPNSPAARPGPDYSRHFWASNTDQGSQQQHIAVLREDGYIILYNGRGRGETGVSGYWAAGYEAGGHIGSYAAIMQSDGNFVLYRETAPDQLESNGYWASGTARSANRITGRSYLRSGEELDTQDCLVSNNGLYFAVMQGDGNFVLYHTTSDVNASPDFSRPYWVNPAPGVELPQNECFATMQGDGNFVLYYRYQGLQEPYWSTNSAHGSSGQFIAVLHDNGNFAVYPGSDPTQVGTPLWQSNTVMDPSALTLTILSGNNQNVKAILQAGHYASLVPLVVQVKHQNGQPAPNVQVTFGVYATSGGLDVQFTPGGNSSPITLTTDSNGIVSLSGAAVNCYYSDGCGFTIGAQVGSNSISFNGNVINS